MKDNFHMPGPGPGSGSGGASGAGALRPVPRAQTTQGAVVMDHMDTDPAGSPEPEDEEEKDGGLRKAAKGLDSTNPVQLYRLSMPEHNVRLAYSTTNRSEEQRQKIDIQQHWQQQQKEHFPSRHQIQDIVKSHSTLSLERDKEAVATVATLRDASNPDDLAEKKEWIAPRTNTYIRTRGVEFHKDEQSPHQISRIESGTNIQQLSYRNGSGTKLPHLNQVATAKTKLPAVSSLPSLGMLSADELVDSNRDSKSDRDKKQYHNVETKLPPETESASYFRRNTSHGDLFYRKPGQPHHPLASFPSTQTIQNPPFYHHHKSAPDFNFHTTATSTQEKLSSIPDFAPHQTHHMQNPSDKYTSYPFYSSSEALHAHHSNIAPQHYHLSPYGRHNRNQLAGSVSKDMASIPQHLYGSQEIPPPNYPVYPLKHWSHPVPEQSSMYAQWANQQAHRELPRQHPSPKQILTQKQPQMTHSASIPQSSRFFSQGHPHQALHYSSQPHPYPSAPTRLDIVTEQITPTWAKDLLLEYEASNYQLRVELDAAFNELSALREKIEVMEKENGAFPGKQSMPSPKEENPSNALVRLSSGVSKAKKTAGQRYWNEEEHQRFLVAMDLYGKKNYRSIANYVKTRNASQVRTHAQKFFIRMKKKSMTAIESKGKEKDQEQEQDQEKETEDQGKRLQSTKDDEKSEDRKVAP